MAESYISELGDSLSHGVANTNGDRVKIIAPKLYNDGNGNHPSIATALSGKAASNHTHGNIQNGGTLQTNDITIANGDKLVVTDSSDTGKVARASISFDGSTTTQALTKAGTWATFNNYSHPAGSAPSKTGVPTANATPGFGGTFKVNQITTDATSHVSAVTERTITIPNATATTSADGLMSAADKTKLDGIAAGTASPLMDGKASVGNSLKYAREDHVHPSDTSREDIANKTTVVLGTSDSKYPTDKAVAEFVNSSIATNTANYISNNGEPFTSVEQLEAYSGPVTNNDYAFVAGIDSEGNTYYDRYKATVSGSTVTWALEYRLNNSSFTAAQWSAINSGITSVLVAKIHDHSNKDVLDGITSDKVNYWDGKEDAFDVLPTTKGGTGTNAASKSELTSSLINSLSTESNTPSDADYYVSQYASGGTTTTSYHRRPVSALWNYIKGKISSVLGLTDSAYSGKAATAGTADKAVADKSGNDIETTYATKSETEEAISNSVDQTYSPTSTKAQSGVAVNKAFKTRETSSSDDSYTYLGMDKTYKGTEALYWKLVSFNAVTYYWTLQFEVDVSNGRKSSGSYDTEIYETKRLTICGANPGSVTCAIELRYAAQGVSANRGYGNNIYYEIGNSNLVTVYIKTIDVPNQTQLCRLKDFINFQGISNLTWYEPTSDAGTQPTNPVKFEEVFPAIASTESNIGGDSVPVYVNKGKPVVCNSSNLKAGKDDDGNVIKNTYATKSELSTHTSNTTVHITAEERTAWNAKQAALTAGDNITIADNVISAEKQVIYAEYGKTSYATVKNAILNGFDVIVRYSGNIYHSMFFAENNTGFIYFKSIGADEIREVHVTTSGWESSSIIFQKKLTFDTTPTAGSTNPVTSGGIKTAIDTVDAKGIVINEIDGENVICFE